MPFRYLFLISILGLAKHAKSQNLDSSNTERSIRAKVLADIQSGLNKKNEYFDSTIAKLNTKINSLDKAIRETDNVREKADKILDRVQVLENKQKALEENELNIYAANYQSAIVNLIYMDREIKPLLLFKSTRNFFESLSRASNPISYPGYQDWMQKFKTYLAAHKSKEEKLNVLSSILISSNETIKAFPMAGPVSQLFFSGVEAYVNSISKRNKLARKEGEDVYILLVKLSQFNHDSNDVEHDWVNISKDLKELQIRYDSILAKNFTMLSISTNDFTRQFSLEPDAEKRYSYLTAIRRKAANYVSNNKSIRPNDWKEEIYFQLMDVQTLKLGFGRNTFLISNYIDSYKTLFEKYIHDTQIGKEVTALVSKLRELKETFDSSFQPTEYINSVPRMYKVN